MCSVSDKCVVCIVQVYNSKSLLRMVNNCVDAALDNSRPGVTQTQLCNILCVSIKKNRFRDRQRQRYNKQE